MNRKRLAALAGLGGLISLVLGLLLLFSLFQPPRFLTAAAIKTFGKDPSRVYLPFAASGASESADPYPPPNTEQKEEPQPERRINLFVPYLQMETPLELTLFPSLDLRKGEPLTLRFTPGASCRYGERRVCVSDHWDGWVRLVTVHSGLGGEAEELRRSLEGWGLDRAGYTREQIEANLHALRGARARLAVEGSTMEDLEIKAVLRIPPQDLEEYFGRPFDATLEDLAQEYTEVAAALDNGRDSLLMEFCGWQLNGETLAPGSDATTASVYLLVIQTP